MRSFLFKVGKVHQKTAIRIHFYTRRDYTQISNHPETSEKSSYDTFIPGAELLLDNLIYFIETQKEGTIEIDVSGYNIEMPKNGLFGAIECLGYYDNEGIITDQASKPTKLEMHVTGDDNYCGRFIIHNSWRNINKWIKHDFETVLKAKPDSKTFVAPSFALKVAP